MISSDDPGILADGISSTTVRAYVGDANGLPVQGTTVDWDGGTGIGELVPVSVTTDSLGTATAIFYSGASVTDAQQTVSVTSGSFSDDVTIPLKGVTVEASINASSLPADGESTAQVNATIRETTSGLAVIGGSVRFAANTGSVQQFGTTNESGIATATYHAGTTPGVATITCTYGETLSAQD